MLLRTLDSTVVIEEEVHLGWAFGRLDEAFDIHVRANPVRPTYCKKGSSMFMTKERHKRLLAEGTTRLRFMI